MIHYDDTHYHDGSHRIHTRPQLIPALHRHHPRHVTRRQWIKGAGALAAFAPFSRSVPARAQASTPSGLKNLVVVTWPEGLELDWSVLGESGSNYVLPPILASLEAHRDQLLLTHGFRGSSENVILLHSENTLGLWTGATVKGGQGLQELSTHPSIDQVVAERIGMDTPYPSLHFGAQTNIESFISTPYLHYSGRFQPIPAEDDPSAMFGKIFQTSEDPATLAAARARKQSVLDFVNTQLTSLAPGLASDDRIKLEKHSEGIRTLERTLDSLGESTCTTSDAPPLTKEAALLDENFPEVIRIQTELMARALECGLTRVATLQMTNTDSQTLIPGLTTNRTVHSAQHNGTAADRIAIGTFFVERLADVLDTLRSIETSPGTTLLDETLVVFGSEMSVGTHGFVPIPYMLAGGGSYFKWGQYIKLPETQRHTRLLTSVVHAMGATDIDTFGEFSGPDAEGPADLLLG